MELILLLIIIVLLLTVAFASYSFAPWLPTRKKDLARILKLAQLKPGQTFFDLGCGDGKVVAYVAGQSRARAIGIELALPFYLIAKLRQITSRRKNLLVKFNNLFQEDLSSADVVYFFAGSKDKLKGTIKQKLEREAKPGARIISYAFPVAGWQPAAMDKPTEKDIAIYLYTI